MLASRMLCSGENKRVRLQLQKWMYIFNKSNETYTPWRRCHDRKIRHKNALNETVSIPTKGLYDTALRNPKHDEVSRVLQREKRDDARKACTCTYRSTLHCWGFDWGNLVQGYLCITCWSYSQTPIFISSKQWWIGICCLYRSRMICDPGWTLQWFTKLFVGRLQ